MYHPTSRVLTVLELLQSQPGINGSELSTRLEVDIRTIRRYILTLQEMGIPVETMMGRYGGYRLRAGFKLPPLMFNNEEVFALMLGLLMARAANIDSIAPTLEGITAKIERVLPQALRQQIQSFQETHVIHPPMTEARVKSSVVEMMSTAVQQCQRVWMRYRPERGDESERIIDPYGIVYYREHWYVPGYCHLREDIRLFRLDRVLESRSETGTFTRPVDFRPLAYVIESIRDIPDTWNVEVVLATTMEEAQGKVPETLAALEQQADGVVLYAAIGDLDWMAHFLVGLNMPFFVRNPIELRTALHKLADDIQHTASRSMKTV
jgi:predicted DNA-binding transcriptional regulator YafY